MNRLVLFILLLSSSVRLIAQENAAGIVFQKGDFQSVLNKAKAENKLVFMDVYTTWCGPCKMLDRNTFSNAQVGNIFNGGFVNYKLDAEQGEGISLARKYGVRAYPNMLFINGQGELVHRVVGYSPPEELLQEADVARQKVATMKPLSWFEENYPAKKTDKAFMQTYVIQLKAANKDYNKIMGEYFALLSADEKVSEPVVKFSAEHLNQLEGPAYELLASIMREAAKHPRGVLQAAYSGLMQVKSAVLQKAIETKDRKLLDRLIQVSKETDGPGAVAQIQRYELEFAKATGDISSVRKNAEQQAENLMKLKKEELAKRDAEQYALFSKKPPMDGVDTTSAQYKRMQELMKNAATKSVALKLNELAWNHLENMTDKADWTKALAWSAYSLELDRNPNSLDTYAQLLYKLGNRAEAIKIQTEAVEKANAEQKEDFMDILDRMKRGVL